MTTRQYLPNPGWHVESLSVDNDRDLTILMEELIHREYVVIDVAHSPDEVMVTASLPDGVKLRDVWLGF